MIHFCKAVGIKTSGTMARIRTAHRRGDNTPQPLWPLRDWFDHLVRDTCNAAGAKTSCDASSRLERAR
jgi:hypothetical protein